MGFQHNSRVAVTLFGLLGKQRHSRRRQGMKQAAVLPEGSWVYPIKGWDPTDSQVGTQRERKEKKK